MGGAVAGGLLFRARGRAVRPGVEPGCSRSDTALLARYQDSVSSCVGQSDGSRCPCTITFLYGLALAGVARAAAAAQGDPWASIPGGITVLGSIGHVRTIRAAHSWHIGQGMYLVFDYLTICI